MEDVIFAGTAGRPPLGRAEVTLTIDNADGALPIDYTEVSITRRMYRSGESEYEINGDKVRLLDVQELLSDSGIGREQHVIVGQGQLDAVLSGRPEDRRAFVEEAAGVLKHRRRKEKALRKLDAMQANLDRLGDLTAELRRQLKPLGRQAEVARRAAGVQADLRDARLRLLADDLVHLRDDAGQGGRRRDRRARAPRRRRGRARRGRRARGGPRGRPGGQRAAARRRAGHLVPAVRADRALPRRRRAGRGAPPAPVGADGRGDRWPRPRPAGRRGRPDRRHRGRARRRAGGRAGPAGDRRRRPRRAGRRARCRGAGLGRGHPRAGRPARGPGPALRSGRRRPLAGRRPGRPRSTGWPPPPPRPPSAPRRPPTGWPGAATRWPSRRTRTSSSSPRTPTPSPRTARPPGWSPS